MAASSGVYCISLSSGLSRDAKLIMHYELCIMTCFSLSEANYALKKSIVGLEITVVVA